MVELHRILCPVDLSSTSEHALEHAVALARWYRAHLTVLHVYRTAMSIPPPPPPPLAVGGVAGQAVLLEPVQRDEIRADVERFCAPAIAAGASLEIVVEGGSPATEIAAEADRRHADLVVMGTHERGRLERVLAGSLTEKVLHTTRHPVLTVPPRAEHAPSGPILYKTILCAIDFSDSSIRALEYAFLLAKEADARLILLHVLEPLLDPTAYGEAADFSVPEYQRRLEEDAIGRLKAVVPVGAAGWCTPEEKVASGNPHREILRAAAENTAELIVIGAHGSGTLRRLLFGSTTRHVIEAASCPVLTLRA
jgi:nucleotide-binding universal stress UspA family protein